MTPDKQIEVERQLGGLKNGYTEEQTGGRMNTVWKDGYNMWIGKEIDFQVLKLKGLVSQQISVCSLYMTDQAVLYFFTLNMHF